MISAERFLEQQASSRYHPRLGALPFPAVVGRRPVEPNSITTELRPLAAVTRRGVRDTHDTQGVSQSACRGFLTIRMIWMHAGRRPSAA